MTKQSQCIKLSENRTNLTFFRITLLEKPNPMLKVPLRSVFYSNILLHPSFCGKYIRIQVPSQRNFQDGGDLVLPNEPNVFQTSGKSNVGRNYSLMTVLFDQKQEFPAKKCARSDGNKLRSQQTSIHTIVLSRLHAYLTTSFLHYSSLSLRGNINHSLRFVKHKVRKDWGQFAFKQGPHRLLFKLIEYLVL